MVTGPGAPSPSGIPGFNAAQVAASATTAQAGATPLPAFLNEVYSAGVASGGVMLPPAEAGMGIVVNNDSGGTITVFGNLPAVGAGDTIAAHGSTSQTATGTGITQANAVIAIYYCILGVAGNTNAPTAGQWKQMITA